MKKEKKKGPRGAARTGPDGREGEEERAPLEESGMDSVSLGYCSRLCSMLAGLRRMMSA